MNVVVRGEKQRPGFDRRIQLGFASRFLPFFSCLSASLFVSFKGCPLGFLRLLLFTLVASPPVNLTSAYQTYFPVLLPASLQHNIATGSQHSLLFRTVAFHQLAQHATMQKLPGFSFSKYNYLQSTPTLVVSKQTFTSLFSEDIHNNRLLIKLKESLTEQQYAYMVDATRSLFFHLSDVTHSLQDDATASFAERRSLFHSIADAQLALDVYFYVVAPLCCVLLFFATWISIQ